VNLSFRKIMQFLKARIFYKSTQDSSNQIVYESDSSTVLLSRSATDNSTIQTQAIVS